jgi:hypothetical protein
MLALSLLTATLVALLQCEAAQASAATQRYFNTSRPEKIIGALITDASQVEEVVGFSNAFSPEVDNVSKLPQYLQANASRMLPILNIGAFMLDPITGILRSDYLRVVSEIVAALSSNHSGPVLFFFDEPLWHIRLACEQGKQLACNEVAQRYADTLRTAQKIGDELRRAIPGAGMMHVEAYEELSRQMAAWNGIVMLDDAEYLAFDCYGAIHDCGGRAQAEYLCWIMSARDALELVNPIGRKIFLVTGTFKDFYAFPDENRVIDQIRTYFEALDSSEILGGIGAFSWGNVLAESTPFLGARSLPEVRPALVSLMRERVLKGTPFTLPPVLALVGAFVADTRRWHASFNSIRVPAGIDALLYVQTAGTDTCTLAVTNEAPMLVTANSLHAWIIRNRPGATIEANASCIGGGRSIRASIRFEFG